MKTRKAAPAMKAHAATLPEIMTTRPGWEWGRESWATGRYGPTGRLRPQYRGKLRDYQLQFIDEIAENFEVPARLLTMDCSEVEARVAAWREEHPEISDMWWGEPADLKLVKGGRYNWRNQSERLVYLGENFSGNGYWHQFAKVEEPCAVWCEVLDSDLKMIEVTK